MGSNPVKHCLDIYDCNSSLKTQVSAFVLRELPGVKHDARAILHSSFMLYPLDSPLAMCPPA